MWIDLFRHINLKIKFESVSFKRVVFIFESFFGCLKSQSLALLEGLLESTLHIEGGFGVVVPLAFQ
jgi:hypothetical protein